MVISGCCASHLPSGTGRQQIYDLATLQINQYGAEGLAFTPRPVIYTKNADLGQHRQVCRSFDLSDQRISTDRHPEPAHQAFAGTSSEGMPHRGDDLAGPLGLLCVWGTNLWETFGEDSPLGNRHSGNASDPDATGASPACLAQEGLSENASIDYGASARWIGNQDRQQSSDRELP